jgi:hypothetical protein
MRTIRGRAKCVGDSRRRRFGPEGAAQKARDGGDQRGLERGTPTPVGEDKYYLRGEGAWITWRRLGRPLGIVAVGRAGHCDCSFFLDLDRWTDGQTNWRAGVV